MKKLSLTVGAALLAATLLSTPFSLAISHRGNQLTGADTLALINPPAKTVCEMQFTLKGWSAFYKTDTVSFPRYPISVSCSAHMAPPRPAPEQ